MDCCSELSDQKGTAGTVFSQKTLENKRQSYARGSRTISTAISGPDR